jgi:hypothetical protein
MLKFVLKTMIRKQDLCWMMRRRRVGCAGDAEAWQRQANFLPSAQDAQEAAQNAQTRVLMLFSDFCSRKREKNKGFERGLFQH